MRIEKMQLTNGKTIDRYIPESKADREQIDKMIAEDPEGWDLGERVSERNLRIAEAKKALKESSTRESARSIVEGAMFGETKENEETKARAEAASDSKSAARPNSNRSKA